MTTNHFNHRRMAASKIFSLRFFPALLSFLCGLSVIPLHAQGRYFQPSEGFVLAKDLPDSFSAKVRSIQLEIKDAFDGVQAHSDAEEYVYGIGNKLHIESRPGTIRRRLLFKEGDEVTKGLLLETEKSLRAEEFLADAMIEVMPWQDGTAHIKVTTFDQWTTVPGFSIQRLGGEWIYWIGPVESNLLGTGQRLGFFIGHDQYRDTRWLDYNNNALFPARLHLLAHAAWLSDGYSVLASLSKPLETRSDKYSFSASISAVKLSEYLYFDNNLLDQLPDSLANAKGGEAHLLEQYAHVATHDLNLSVTRSFGSFTKFNVSPTFDRHDRYNDGKIYQTTDTLRALIPIDPSAIRPDERTDDLLGLSLSVYQYDYKTVNNFRNLKWSETLETGWRLSAKVAFNNKWMGARNSDLYFGYAAVYNNAWWDAVFLNTSASLRYFLADTASYKHFDDGYATAASEIQWKPVAITSSFLSLTWANLIGSEKSQQLLLGEDNGLNGYPNFYYAGQARFLVEAEQRFFPQFEVGTLVPAFAIFGDAGNTFPGYSDFDPDKLHYALGVGLRLGASKSTQKVVNHFNLSWPIGEKNLSGPVFSIRAKKSL